MGSRSLTPLANISYLSNRVISILGCNPSPFSLLGTNTYLVGTGRERLLIDTGSPSVPEYQNLLKKVLNDTQSIIKEIIITHHHSDHIGGLDDVRKLCDRNIPAYKMDFVSPDAKKAYDDSTGTAIEFVKDQHLFKVEGATVTAHYNPGHTDDHMVLWLDEEEALFSADTILGEGTTKFENLSAYMSSLYDIQKMNPRVIYPGHGPVVKEPMPHLNYYIDHRLEREGQIISLLKSSGHSANSIVKILYKDYNVSVHGAAAKVILLHLHKLEDDGIVKCEGDRKCVDTVWTIINHPTKQPAALL